MTDSRDFKKKSTLRPHIFQNAGSFFRGNHAASYLACRGDYADAVRACFGF